MAIIVFSCPFCDAKVETPEENVGREGQCPGCQKISRIPDPRAAQAAKAPARPARPRNLLDGAPAEYQETSALVGVGGVAIALGALIFATTMTWALQYVEAAPFIQGERVLILIGSVACLAFLLISAITRKSLAPAVLAAGAWGVFVLIWVGGMGHALGKMASESGQKMALEKGSKLAMLAAVLTVAGAVYVYYQCRDGEALNNFGFFLLALLAIGCAGGLIVLGKHVRPGLTARHSTPERVMSPAPRAPVVQPPTTEGQAPPGTPEGQAPQEQPPGGRPPRSSRQPGAPQPGQPSAPEGGAPTPRQTR